MKKIDIVLKKLRNNTTPEEEIEFNEWIESSGVNKMLYDRLVQIKKEKKGIHLISELDVNDAWDSIQKRANAVKQNKVVPIYRKKVVQYAAAVLVGILVVSGYWLKELVFVNEAIDEPVITLEKNTVQTGSDKAILTLDDGTDIMLEKGKTFKKNNIESTGEDLIYTKKEAKKVAYNVLTIPRGGQYSISLSDGTKLWLNSESQIKYPVEFIKGENRVVELMYGEAYFDVSSSKLNDGSKFIVRNENQDIEVLGTEFNVKAYQDEAEVYTTLVEGQVLVQQNDVKQNLQPNQQSILNKETASIKVNEVDVYSEISWKEGVFVFDNKSLKEIMKVMSRWYDMEVIFINKDVEEEKFVGALRRNRNIEKLLSSIKLYGSIKDYRINGKKIIIE